MKRSPCLGCDIRGACIIEVHHCIYIVNMYVGTHNVAFVERWVLQRVTLL